MITFCLESVPYFQDQSSSQYKTLYYADIICVAWFTLEFVIRLIFCPKKLQFFKKPMNWIDFGAIVPFYLNLFISQSDIKTMVVLRVVRLIRIFRIFKLSRHSYGLQILGHTLKSSFSELFLLAFFLSIGVVIFSSIIYYAEKDRPSTKFTTIPASFWWAVVTMTTLGYGDMTPETWEGKIVGSFCAISGVLMIALPVPVIVSNFSLYYSHAKARLKLPKRKRPLIIGAANALKVAQSFVTQSSPNLSKEVVDQVEGEGQNNFDTEDQRRESRTRPSPHPSFRSTPRGSPMGRRKLQSPSTVISPPSPRSSLFTPQLAVSRPSLLAVPEDGRIEIEMESRRPSYTVEIEKAGLPSSVTEKESQQPSPSGSKSSSQTCETSSAKALLSPKRSDPDNATSEAKSMPESRQRSTSSAKSVSVDSSQGSPKLKGRMGRRGSLYVVGFTAKHWQNKALKKNKTAQTDPASRRASAVPATDRRGSTACSVVTNGTRKQVSSIGTDPDVSLSEKVSRLDSPQTELPRAEITKDGQNEGAFTSVQGNSNGSVISERHDTSTQTRGGNLSRVNDKTRLRTSPINSGKMRDAYRNAKTNLTSVSIESNDSSSRMSDDSLTVNDHHRQRRGSSPLVRQKAVFTFDMSDKLVQVDPCAGGHANFAAKRGTSVGRSYEDSGFSLSPLIEQSNEMGAENEISLSRKQMETRRKSCIPAIATEFKISGKKSKSQGMTSNGYINGSYHHDEEDKMASERRLSPSVNSVIGNYNTMLINPESSRRRSDTYPMHLALGGDSYSSAVFSSQGSPYYTEAKSFGQYPPPPHIELTSTSDLDLPSVSEDHHVGTKQLARGASRLQAPPVLPRPNSLPSWSGDFVRPVVVHRPYSDSVYMNHRGAYSFPSNIERLSSSSLGSIQQPLSIPQYISPEVTRTNYLGQPVRRNTFSSFEEQRALSEVDVNDGLSQRRPGQVLYVHIPQTVSDTANPVLLNDRDRFPEVSRKEKSRSLGTTSEQVPSPLYFYRNESISSPDLHSVNGSLTSDRLHSTLSDSWSQPPDNFSKNRTVEESKVNDQRAFVKNLGTTSSSGQDPQARTSSQSDFSVHSTGQIGNESAQDRPSSYGQENGHPEGFENGRGKNAFSTRPERTDRQVLCNGHEFLQQRDSSNRHTALPVSNRQRARAMFVGDSGIDSVNSSTTSMTHSLELDGDGAKERRESVTGHPSNTRVDILNPIDESETEVSESADGARDSKTTPARSTNVDFNMKKQVVLSKAKINGNRMSDILSNSSLYESSLV